MLIKCPECQKEISSEADFCPFCGYPIAKKKESTKSERKSFTVAFRSGPGSIVGTVIVAAIFSFVCLLGSIFVFIASGSINALVVPAILLLILGIIFLITTIVYFGYFSKNNKLMPKNCIEYDADEDKLILYTLDGAELKINVSDYVELKDNFFTDNMLLFTYRTSSGTLRKVKLGYCGNRDQIRDNIKKAERMHE